MFVGSIVPLTVVVDDGSTDGGGDAIRAAFPDVVVLEGDGNLWWSGAMNLGVSWALRHGARHVLSLNNDCVLHQGAVEALAQTVEESAPAIVGSKLRYWDEQERILCAGSMIPSWRTGLVYLGQREIDNGQHDKRREVDWFPGMSVLIPTDVYRQVGLYDARRFPMHWADADLTMRARAAGWRLIYEPKSVVWNDQEQTETAVPWQPSAGQLARLVLSDRRSRFRAKPAVLFFARHTPPSELFGTIYAFYSPVRRAARRRWLHPIARRAREAADRLRVTMRSHQWWLK